MVWNALLGAVGALGGKQKKGAPGTSAAMEAGQAAGAAANIASSGAGSQVADAVSSMTKKKKAPQATQGGFNWGQAISGVVSMLGNKQRTGAPGGGSGFGGHGFGGGY